MRLWILLGAFTALAAPQAFANERGADCATDDTREQARARADATPPPPPANPQHLAAAPPAVAAAPAVTPTPPASRRRGGSTHRIPDAELIGPRGAL